MREVWRPVPECAGLLASSHGRLMVAPYYAPLPNGGQRVYGGVPARGTWEGTRYVWRWRGKSCRVAPLVCAAFHGKRPKGRVCIHRNENARHNRATNLKWGTQKENLNMPKFIAYCRGRTGANSPYTKGRA
jgi:hypothetical protein